MGYICNNCGSESTFTGQEHYTTTGTRSTMIDNNGEWLDDCDYEEENCDAEGDVFDLECDECGSNAIIWTDSNDELEEIRRRFSRETKNSETKTVKSWKKRINSSL